MQVGCDAQRSVSDARRREHGPAHVGRIGAIEMLSFEARSFL
jgi:hypothetical protein